MIQSISAKNFLLFTSFCTIGCISCLLLQQQLSLPSFLASALVGLVGSFIPESFHQHSKQFVACIYTGSFAAMMPISQNLFMMKALLLSLLVGFSYSFLFPFFRGSGGKLGSIAFIASLLFTLCGGFFAYF